MILYHGTTAQNAESILRHGFRSYASTEGVGVYLAADPDFAAEFAEKEFGVKGALLEVDADLGRICEVEGNFYLLTEEFDDLYHPVTEWQRMNAEAIRNTHGGNIPAEGDIWDPDAAYEELTHVAQRKGYDGFSIGNELYVVFDPRRVHPLRIIKYFPLRT